MPIIRAIINIVLEATISAMVQEWEERLYIRKGAINLSLLGCNGKLHGLI